MSQVEMEWHQRPLTRIPVSCSFLNKNRQEPVHRAVLNQRRTTYIRHQKCSIRGIEPSVMRLGDGGRWYERRCYDLELAVPVAPVVLLPLYLSALWITSYIPDNHPYHVDEK